ncbi:cohesin complex subunit [Marasmius tenuissimus]|uniref:Cohesin complex subunit n=1 Tax=Marasmius tenuissimus TaxID=585030 RepID=A0ABR3ACT0_9AGAR
MESSPPSSGPRRSQRDKKQPKPITTMTTIPETRRKRKRAGTDDEGQGDGTDADPEEEEEDVGMDEPDADEDKDDEDEAPKRRKSRKPKAGGPAPKKPRKAAAATAATTTNLAEGTRKTRKPRAPKPVAPADATFDPETFEKLTNIKADNPLFNAIMNPNAALMGTTEDFLESLSQSPNEALAEFVNMVLRCCGCNDTIDGDTAVDLDGVVDRLDDIVEELKKTTTPAGTYPLTSRNAPFHNTKIKYNFRNHLSEFISRLITTAAETRALYNSSLIETLQSWLVPMSSSQIRSIRHTATVVALEVEGALCEVGKELAKAVEVFGRMREGEKKRARTGTTPSTKGKDKELDSKQREVKDRQAKIEEFIKEFIDGVFIHRYRDLDPVIRTECISSLSTFFSTLPSHFASNSEYLRYVGWVLSDSAAQVRLAAVRALQTVYDTAGIGADKKPSRKGKQSANAKDSGGVALSALTQFSTRFLPRLLEIARFDVDVGVRVAVMSVLDSVDELGLLSDSHRNRLGTMVYSDEPRVRKGVGKFVSGVWEDWVETRLGEVEVEAHAQIAAANRGRGRGRGRGGGRGGSSPVKGRGRKVAEDEEVDEGKLGIKGLVLLLVKWGRTLDRERKGKGTEEEDDDEDDDEVDEGPSGRKDDETDSNATREHGGMAATLATATATSGGKRTVDGATGTLGAGSSSRTSQDVKGRTALAVEAVWDELDIVRDWEGILDMLVLDHSASGSDNGGDGDTATTRRSHGRGGRAGKGALVGSKRQTMKRRADAANGDAGNLDDEEDEEDEDLESAGRVHDAWRLTEVEEGVLLEILVASIRKSRKEDETSAEPITQALIKALPPLFVKYQTDEHRIADVLALPNLMNLEVYIEMRETSAYASLWSDISKQFLTHTSPFVLTAAVQSMSYLLSNTSLSNTNSEQILALEDELATSLREAAAEPPSPPGSPSKVPKPSSARRNRDLEVTHFTEDEVITLSSVVLRLRMLVSSRDLTAWIEDNEGGKQSSAWDILSAISERGMMGIGGEEQMIEQALQVLTLHTIWKSRALPSKAEPSPEEKKYQETFLNQRDALLQRLTEFAVGTQEIGNGVSDTVKRTAFKNLVDLHVLFAASDEVSADGTPLPHATEPVALTMDDEVQWRCAGYLQAEIERYAESLEEEEGPDEAEDDSSEDEGSQAGQEGGEEVAKKKTKRARKPKVPEATDEDEASRSELEQEYLFIDVVSTFLRAIRCGAIHVRHGATLLAHYGQLGAAYDACVKVVIEAVKEEGMMNGQGDSVVLVVTQAMKESFTIALISRSPDESEVVALAKLLATCFVIRGSQLAIVRRLDAQYIIQIQTNLLSWIANHLEAHLKINDKKALKNSLLFFRALVPLVSSVDSRDALRVKAHLDQVFAQHNIEPGTTKAWEPYRAYEKRLGTVLAKDKPGGASKGRKKKKAATGASTDGEESEVERLIGDDDGALSDAPALEPQRTRPRPRPQRRTRSRAKNPLEDVEQNGQESEHDDEEPVTPKARPRTRRNAKNKSSEKERADTDAEETEETMNAQMSEAENAPPLNAEDTLSVLSQKAQNGFVTPKKTPRNPRKRAREDVDEEREEVQPLNDESEPQPEPEPTPAAAFQVKRKRIRH